MTDVRRRSVPIACTRNRAAPLDTPRFYFVLDRIASLDTLSLASTKGRPSNPILVGLPQKLARTCLPERREWSGVVGPRSPEGAPPQILRRFTPHNDSFGAKPLLIKAGLLGFNE